MNELTIKLTDIKKSFDDKEILDIETLTAYAGDKIAVIGENGAGKSTLLKIIHGDLTADAGQVQRETEFNYFAQIGRAGPVTSDEMDFELLSHFDVPDHEDLSGGEETKLRLAETLSSYRTGLLLDEPTTHLDQTGINLLIEELEYYYGTLIFISHDRHLINRIATKVWEVDDGGVKVYNGDYDDYKTQKELERVTLSNRHKNVADEKKRLEAAAQKQKIHAEKMNRFDKKKAKTNDPGHRGQSKPKDIVQKNAFKKVKAIESRMDQLEDIALPDEHQELKFPLAKSERIYNTYPVLIQNLTVSRGGKVLLAEISFQLPFGETIAITGDNGSGKSSLLEEIINHNPAIEMSPKIKIATYRQMDYKYDDDMPVIKYMMNQTDAEESLIRSVLSRLGFTQNEVLKPLNSLSGGEATRISLAMLFMESANMIILDEPTNFIDLATIEALEDFIRAYEGMVIVTSHDHAFISRVADVVYKIENQKMIRKD